MAPNVDETPRTGESAVQTALRLAELKARAGVRLHPAALVIGSDQVAVLDEVQLGKPGDHASAVAQLRAMRGRTVIFHTALCVCDGPTGRRQIVNVPTTVTFREFTDAHIERYLAREQPYDCAGSAKIEGLGIALVEHVSSDDPTALPGLPLTRLITMLRNEGIEVIQAATMPGTGTLYLIPTALGGSDPGPFLPSSTLRVLSGLTRFIVENPKSARQFLKAAGHPHPLRSLDFRVLDEHTTDDELPDLLDPLRAGQDWGLMSEAGCPAVADPGATLVKLAHARGVRVVPLVGPSAVLLALMASGLNGQRFAFHGYLPVEARQRRARIVGLERESARNDETQIFIETPYRNDALLRALIEACRDDTLLCLATDITLPTETVLTQAVVAWRRKLPALNRRPTVFLLYSGS